MTKQRWIESNGVMSDATTPSPEVQPPERRTRSAADKLRILQQYDAHAAKGNVCAYISTG